MSTQQIGPGHHVRVANSASWFHDCHGVVLAQGRWGWLLVELVKDGKLSRSEIRRGHLVLESVPIVAGKEEHQHEPG